MFHESSTRTVNAELAEPADPVDPSSGYIVKAENLVPHRYRPLDDRYLYGHRRFIDRPGSISTYFREGTSSLALITMDTRTSAGPIVIATNTLPGDDSFRGSYGTHVFPLGPPPTEVTLVGVGDEGILALRAREWADALEASAEDVGAYLLALGNAPSYSETFAEAMEAEIVRLPATMDAGLFREVVAVGRLLLEAWSLRAAPLGWWTQLATGTRLGTGTINGSRIAFENGDYLDGIHAGTGNFAVSGYPVMQRYLEAREHLSLSVQLAENARHVAGAIACILNERAACDDLLRRVIAGPTSGLL